MVLTALQDPLLTFSHKTTRYYWEFWNGYRVKPQLMLLLGFFFFLIFFLSV